MVLDESTLWQTGKSLLTPPPEIIRDPFTSEILPSSICREPKGVMVVGGQKQFPIFCANCGVDGGFVPEPSKDFAFYLCDEDRNNCSGKWSHMVDYMIVPQEKFWEIARLEQLARLGRLMTVEEILEAERDPNHWLWTLERSARNFLKR